MIHRIYVEKKEGLRKEEAGILSDARSLYGIADLSAVRLLKRYDFELSPGEAPERAVREVFSEPMVDLTYAHLEEAQTEAPADFILGVEALPGQFDQRADSAEQCLQMLFAGPRPKVRSAKIYLFYGPLSKQDQAALRRLLINPVDSREASLGRLESLSMNVQEPEAVPILTGFRKLDQPGLQTFLADHQLAMGLDDLTLIQNYFIDKQRDPSLAEIAILDTYWSDHCRHTTFNTTIDAIHFEDPLLEGSYQHYLKTRQALGRTKPITFMDLGTIAAKALRASGQMEKIDVSEEINACTVKIEISVDGRKEPWLLLFKNETHNHPTEIEPFGGAATCIGGAIRDPLSGRAYVYAAMRLTGAGNPLAPLSETLPGKLPQRKICREAARGYSSYGNQIGLATGLVRELYHPDYVAKRLEIGAVIGAVPERLVRRERPQPGDPIILLGGRTGRDGIGGATGSSKAQNVSSQTTAGAEVQKGNAPEERKLQRLFRNPKAVSMIKRCNDFGAGGVSVAIGELADGLDIDLDRVPKKYEGLNGLELAISESQERMAVCIDPEDFDAFMALAAAENLEATHVATVSEEPVLHMTWRGETIVDLDRSFLDENGAEKHITIQTKKARPSFEGLVSEASSFREAMEALVNDLNGASQRGLGESFDASIGKGTVLMPFGGKNQLTPPEAMVHKISLEEGDTEDVSFMSWGFDPYLTERSPYHGAYYAVIDALSKLVAAGANLQDTYLTFQEYFLRLDQDPERWGIPLAALLGAYQAQMDMGIGAIGGKDSMSGSFESLNVPPTLAAFAVTTGKLDQVLSPELKGAHHRVSLLAPHLNAEGLPEVPSLRAVYQAVEALHQAERLHGAACVGMGGVAHKIFEMALGNGIGFRYNDVGPEALQKLLCLRYGALLVESDAPLRENQDIASFQQALEAGAFDLIEIGESLAEPILCFGQEQLALADLLSDYEGKLESVYPLTDARGISERDRSLLLCPQAKDPAQNPLAQAHLPKQLSTTIHSPAKVLIPVCPGTNTEYDAAIYVRESGLAAEIFVVKNQTAEAIRQSAETFCQALRQAQVLFLPGGFSGGDEPDGSAKFITSFLRNPACSEEIEALLYQREGLILGICNGFQALMKLGLLPYGHIQAPSDQAPTLTYNRIGRHQSRIVSLRIASTDSPWLSLADPTRLYQAPISHGEGQIVGPDALIRRLAEEGRIATQYADFQGQPSMDIRFNPNGSLAAIEGLLACDGRILGKMGHNERHGRGLYQNVPGDYDLRLFEAAKRYFDQEA